MTRHTWAIALATGAFTTALIGGVALAGFQPFAAPDATGDQSIQGGPTAGLVQRDLPKDRLKATLDALVAKGTITQAQEDAILKALQDAAPPAKPKPAVRPLGPNFRSFIGNVTQAASAYLGLGQRDLMLQLRSGKSIADIANGLSAQGKNSADLIARLVKTANDKVDAAVAAKKLTPEQAATLKPKIATEITAIVQRSPKAH